MASAGHCAFCFETVAADLEQREALDYVHVLDLWKQFTLLKNPRAMQARTAEPSREHGGEEDDDDSLMTGTEADDDDDDDEADDHEVEDDQGGAEQGKVVQPKPTSLCNGLRLPSISRLQAPSPASRSSSSSTPSSLSTSSSAAALGGNSRSSSNSSFFSFGRSKQPSPAVALKEEEYPLFVTWNTVSIRSGNKSLRGCIGTFEPHDLASGLRSYALTAAFDDTRFAPISLNELPSLSASITLLTDFTPCAHAMDWDIGTHGIRISFLHHEKRYGATYLPDVAFEQGWTKEETLISLMRKAGWNGRRREWRDVKSLNVVKYQGKKASLGYPEYREWRDWVRMV